jgi:limonene-1,2-epoxide hydrolase
MDNDQRVRTFCDAWGRGDLEAIMAAFTVDAIYHNVPMQPCNGEAEIRAMISGFLATNPEGVEFEILHQVSQGNIVMNERIDRLVLDGKAIEARVCGVFELNDDGLIAAWRDYFDMGDFQP